MAELTFSQPERRSYLIPALGAFVLLAAFFGYLFWRTPFRIADGAVTHIAVLPEHTVFSSGSKLVGHEDIAEDDLYVVATVRVDNHLKVPLTINDIAGALTASDDTVTNASAIGKNDLANLYVTFPALVPLSGPPLLRESDIQPGSRAEGMVLLHFPLSQADWDQRKSAAITIDFYNQGSLTIAIPK